MRSGGALLALCILGLFAREVAAQGPLTPPGAPAPIYKTLDQVEPRIPISAASLPLTITNSGNYYLTEPILLSQQDTNFITIASSYVTIDLNGFAVTGPGKNVGSTGDFIAASGAIAGITVLNGTLNQMRGGGVNLTGAGVCLVRDLVIEQCGGNGIQVGSSCTVEGCVVHNCGGTGIVGGFGVLITGCDSNSNDVSGISTQGACHIINSACISNDGDGIVCAVSNCSVVNCNSSGSLLRGIVVPRNSTVTNCMTSNLGANIVVTFYCTVTGCVCSNGQSDGIQGQFNNTIIGNHCINNGSNNGGSGAGIHFSAGNFIEGNFLMLNDYGIKVDNDNNFLAQNISEGSIISNYSVNTPTNVVGPIATGLGTITSSNPWANFSY